jgi:hypothetical protein
MFEGVSASPVISPSLLIPNAMLVGGRVAPPGPRKACVINGGSSPGCRLPSYAASPPNFRDAYLLM